MCLLMTISLWNASLHFWKLRITGEYLANIVYEYWVNECGLDFGKCRRQSYDNAANMLGKYNGMHSKIREKNRFALYLPCAGHSLNFVGRTVVDCCLDAVNFFGVVQQLYNFFSGSTHRWAVLQSDLEEDSTVLKRLFNTRGEAHSKATSAVLEGHDSITSALDHMYEGVSEKSDTRREAGNLRDKMEE
ncbi:Zinc finger MYM-type protein 1 [Oopsacas minuta]|uniref:Zinc finger MYM-type protein 1 n=1 Tax=Oopsacas minuta TaxID=111878 RepID=A0AAV7KE36_9METZ|nr:Zinc finger MYM-type protein 1 [Oopsacas minuta]